MPVDFDETYKRTIALEAGARANVDILMKVRRDLEDLKNQQKDLEKATEVLKNIGDQKKQATIEMFERVISVALKEVFNSTYKFRIEMQPQTRGVFTKFKLLDGNNEIDILTGCGGGIIDVVSFVLRALILSSIRPRRNKLLFLDETFKHVSGDYLPRVARLLRSLADQLQMQFVLVSHKPEFMEVADKAYELYRTPEGTKARKISKDSYTLRSSQGSFI